MQRVRFAFLIWIHSSTRVFTKLTLEKAKSSRQAPSIKTAWISRLALALEVSISDSSKRKITQASKWGPAQEGSSKWLKWQDSLAWRKQIAKKESLQSNCRPLTLMAVSLSLSIQRKWESGKAPASKTQTSPKQSQIRRRLTTLATLGWSNSTWLTSSTCFRIRISLTAFRTKTKTKLMKFSGTKNTLTVKQFSLLILMVSTCTSLM